MSGGEFDGGATRSGAARAKILLARAADMQTPIELAIDRALRSVHPVAILRFYLSRLTAPSGAEYHGRIARLLFDETVQVHGGQIVVAGPDLVLFSTSAAAAGLGASLTRLFRSESSPKQPIVLAWLLPEEVDAARAALADLPPSDPAELQATPIGALGAINALLAVQPAFDVIRRQEAVRLDGRAMHPLFSEVGISLPAIEARLQLDLPRNADPYLQRYLAEQLDERMLVALAASDLSRYHALNINLPLAHAASPGFLALRAAARNARIPLGVGDRLHRGHRRLVRLPRHPRPPLGGRMHRAGGRHRPSWPPLR